MDVDSLEGIFKKSPKPVIVLGANRPAGRRRFTAAHELGHYVFGHELAVDMENPDGSNQTRNTPEETLANAFAQHLLMPRTVLLAALRKFQRDDRSLEPKSMYQAAQWIGVGYSTIIRHLQYGFNLLNDKEAKALLRMQPADIRNAVLGSAVDGNLFYLDERWTGRPADLEVGDYFLSNGGTATSTDLVSRADKLPDGTTYKVNKPGVCLLSDPRANWSITLRISRRSYAGHAKYRHLEETNED
jgi:hypothetical protein